MQSHDHDYDLVVRGATLASAAEVFEADLGVKDGTIAAVGRGLRRGAEEIDARGLIVTPGGLDPHCHIEEPAEGGGVQEESFVTGSAAALAGGTTSFICFVPQWKGHPIAATADSYEATARAAMADYSFHQIITDPTPDVLEREVPALVARGIRSLKVFLTYDPLRLTDGQFLEVLATARRLGALVTVHCENFDAIGWRIRALLAAGLTDPLQHAWARPPVVEREATHRAIALAELVDQPIQVFHVSCDAAAEEIARARARGVKVWGETCPQYLTLSTDDLARPDFEGAKAVCSPALRAPESGRGSGPGSRTAPSTWCRPTIAASPSPPPSAIPAAAATARAARRPAPTGCQPSTRSPTACRASRPGCRCCSRRASRPAASTCRPSCG